MYIYIYIASRPNCEILFRVFSSDFSSCFKRKYRINEPTFIDNMKMEGIGSEGGPKGSDSNVSCGVFRLFILFFTFV